MPFDTALSGIRAASTDLTVTGNNIANASTTGFKSSRTEFADVYATSVLGSGNTAIGSGVQVSDVSQNFVQGNVTFTEKELDLAINGNGFFMLEDGGETQYSRAGAFGLDDQGFIVNASGAYLQGFVADAEGNIDGIPSDISIQTSNLDPRRTTSVESVLNLDAAEPVLQESGRQFTTEGFAVAVAQVGLQDATTSTLTSGAFTLPLANDFSTTPMDFDVTLAGQGTNLGTVSVSLDSTAGVPTTVTTFNDLRILASVINSQIFAPSGGQSTIDVVAEAVDLGGGNYELQLSQSEEGLTSTISVSNQTANVGQVGLIAPVSSTSGVPQVSNGYPAQTVDIETDDGSIIQFTSQAGDTAAQIAANLNSLQGVSATATTELAISNYVNSTGNLTTTINGVELAGDSLATLEAEINSLTNTTLPGISARLEPSGTVLTLMSAGGDDIEVSIAGPDDGDQITVLGDPDSAPVTLEVDTDAIITGADASLNSVVVGGVIDIVFEEGYDLISTADTSVFQPVSPSEFTEIIINEFDPSDQSTYNSATSMTVYDSLGIPHVMTQYFVKQEYDPTDPTSAPNHWQVNVLIDGADVGDPDTTLPPPANTEPTRASYDLYFNDDGSLNQTSSDNILISNWVPLDEDGNPNSAAGPQNVLAGGGIPIADPPTSSNFTLDFTGTTQFGSDFSVNNVDQNGYATGRLSGLSIDESGIIFARFTNGESLVLGQVALASFPSEEGLSPVGSTAWVETFRSGQPRVAAANTGALGTIQSGALEESNVDISAELVNLILAQRNFQASAKTIQTADSVTQTIINLR